MVKKEWVKEESCCEKEHQGQEKYHHSQHEALWMDYPDRKMGPVSHSKFLLAGESQGSTHGTMDNRQALLGTSLAHLGI